MKLDCCPTCCSTDNLQLRTVDRYYSGVRNAFYVCCEQCHIESFATPKKQETINAWNNGLYSYGW